MSFGAATGALLHGLETATEEAALGGLLRDGTTRGVSAPQRRVDG